MTERLKRNETEFRLSQKSPKRNIEKSRASLLEQVDKYKLNTDSDFFYAENYLKINNTNLSAEEAAQIIIKEFRF